MLKALVIRRSAIAADPALAPGARGVRKVLVTDMRAGVETRLVTAEWTPATPCPVQVTENVEVSVFNETAAQDRHMHRRATEMYVPIEGLLRMEVDGAEYEIGPGDAIVVNAGSWHQVIPGSEPLLCYVFTANCGGAADKFTSSAPR